MMSNYVFIFLISLFIGLLLGYPIILACKKLKIGQPTLHYVKEHKNKEGTPTMGGLIFILSSILAYLIFFKATLLKGWLCFIVMLCYGILGFLDDFIKIKTHNNEGLKPYQKIVGQLGIAIVIAIYIYLSVGTSIDLFGINLNLSWGIIPFTIFIYIATTNSVNLTDGLDGLAGGVTFIFLFFFSICLMFLEVSSGVILSCFALMGGLLAFLFYNFYPAKIFMGDTGSLALGGFISTIVCVTKQEVLLPIIGLMFVLSSVSDIIQVLYYKKTKKRVFLMAPLHHHFQKKGCHENKIVVIYIIVTIILGSICLLIESL